MRILALDLGEKRIGVAISDALNITAQGLETIHRKSTKHAIDRVMSLVEEYDIVKIIVGAPFNLNGTEGNSMGLVKEFTSLLEKEVSIDIEMVDERLTTAQAERVLLGADVSRKKRKAYIDKIAAQLILQAYLDSECTKE